MNKQWRIRWVVFFLFCGIAHAAHYGLFVGLNEYSPLYISSDNWLNYCVADAGSMRTNLVNHGAGWATSNTTLLVNSAGTKTAIRAALSNVAVKAISGDVVVYFHSSHGGNDNLTQADVYLCAYEANYTEDELATDLSSFKTGVEVIVIVDACHSGGLFVETAALSLADKEARRRIAREWNIAKRVTTRMEDLRSRRLLADARAAARLISPDEIGWMTACAYYEYSYEAPEIGHGWFTYRLLQGFDYGDASGDGWASFQELFDFASLRIPYADQTPQSLNPAILATRAGTAGLTPPGDAWDYADNVVDGATDLVPSAQFLAHGPHTLRQDLDESDFFAIPVKKNRCITLRSTQLTGDVDAYLYTWSEGSGLQMVRYAYDIVYPANLNFEMTYKAPASGTVYLRVEPYFDGRTNAIYTLEVANAGTADSFPTLTNGVAHAIPVIPQNTGDDFHIVVPAGQTNLTFTLGGGTGDADLYVARGYIPWEDEDYVSQEYGNTEYISIDNPSAGDWFVQVWGYDPSSNMTLRATCTPGAALIGAVSNSATAASFAVDLTNGARVSIYSTTNLVPADGHLDWQLRSNNAVVVNGTVRVNLRTNAVGELISVGRPLDR